MKQAYYIGMPVILYRPASNLLLNGNITRMWTDTKLETSVTTFLIAYEGGSTWATEGELYFDKEEVRRAINTQVDTLLAKIK